MAEGRSVYPSRGSARVKQSWPTTVVQGLLQRYSWNTDGRKRRHYRSGRFRNRRQLFYNDGVEFVDVTPASDLCHRSATITDLPVPVIQNNTFKASGRVLRTKNGVAGVGLRPVSCAGREMSFGIPLQNNLPRSMIVWAKYSIRIFFFVCHATDCLRRL